MNVLVIKYSTNTSFWYNDLSLAMPERSISTTLQTAVVNPRLLKLYRFPYRFAIEHQILSLSHPEKEISGTALSHLETRRMKQASAALTTSSCLLGQILNWQDSVIQIVDQFRIQMWIQPHLECVGWTMHPHRTSRWDTSPMKDLHCFRASNWSQPGWPEAIFNGTGLQSAAELDQILFVVIFFAAA